VQITLNAQTIVTKEIENEIDKIFGYFSDLNKPGAAIAVVKNQEVIFKKGYGSANLEYGIPISSSTVFNIASVSKQFTVFSILLLEQEGKLSFDDDIRKHIPEVPYFGQTITLRHLAAHTSGMRDQWRLLRLSGWKMDDVITQEHILNIVSQQKELNFNPGEEYLYCNTGYTLLAEVVARVSGKTFAEFAEENILKPLKMNNSLFYDSYEKIVKNRAYSYYRKSDKSYKRSVLNYVNVGATGLYTTVEDLALWSMNFSTHKVGNKNIVDKMNALAVLNNGETFGGAYGQFIKKHKGLNLIEHDGADAGYRSYLGRFPEQDLAVIVFSNLGQANPTYQALKVADLFLKDDIVEEKIKKTKSKPKFVKLTNSQLEKFSGYYWSDKNNYARKIYVKNDTLRYFRSETSEDVLAPVSKTKFKMLNVDVDLFVWFTINDNKKQMIIQTNDYPPIPFNEFTPPNYTSSNLEEFCGEYYSPELNTTYKVITLDNELHIKHYRLGTYTIFKGKTDLFKGSDLKGSNYIFEFERDKNRQITGFNVSDDRIKNIWFKKIE